MSQLHEAVEFFRDLDEGYKIAKHLAGAKKPGLWDRLKGAAKHAAGAAKHAIKQDWERSGWQGGKAQAAKTPYKKPEVDLAQGEREQKVADERNKIKQKLGQHKALKTLAKSKIGQQGSTDAPGVKGAVSKLRSMGGKQGAEAKAKAPAPAPASAGKKCGAGLELGKVFGKAACVRPRDQWKKRAPKIPVSVSPKKRRSKISVSAAAMRGAAKGVKVNVKAKAKAK